MPSKKVLAEKQQFVENLAQELKEAKSMVFIDYQGLNVAQDTEMRAALRKENVKYQIVKNSMSNRAFEKIGITDLSDVLVGPTAIVYSTEDVVAPARLMKKFIDQFKKAKMKGGILEGARIEESVVNALAVIPSTDVLYGRVVSMLLSPISSFAITLGAIAKKAEEAGVEKVSDVAVGACPVEAKTETVENVEQAKAEVVEEAKAEEPKVEEVKTEEVKTEEPKVEEVKAEEQEEKTE